MPDIGELLDQDIGDLMMDLLAFTLEHGLIRCILQHGMFEDPARLGKQTFLKDQLSLHELSQPPREPLLIGRPDRPDQGIRKGTAEDSADLDNIPGGTAEPGRAGPLTNPEAWQESCGESRPRRFQAGRPR